MIILLHFLILLQNKLYNICNIVSYIADSFLLKNLLRTPPDLVLGLYVCITCKNTSMNYNCNGIVFASGEKRKLTGNLLFVHTVGNS